MIENDYGLDLTGSTSLQRSPIWLLETISSSGFPTWFEGSVSPQPGSRLSPPLIRGTASNPLLEEAPPQNPPDIVWDQRVRFMQK